MEATLSTMDVTLSTMEHTSPVAISHEDAVAKVGDNLNSTPPEKQPEAVVIHIPDMLHKWPWPRALNPHFEQCRAESDRWIRSFKVFSPAAQAAFNKCEFSLLASLGWPKLNKDGCRIGCDLMNFFFVFDDLSDVSDATQTRYQADCIMDALRNPHKPRPEGEWIGGQIAKEFWQNAIKTATPSCQSRFILSFEHYTNSVVRQSADRDTKHIHTIESFFALRRETIGVSPSIVILGVHFHIPDHMVRHPTVERLAVLCADLIAMGNDLYSYNKEQACGDEGHNLITVVMKERGLDVQEAFDWVGRCCDVLIEEFGELYEDLPWFEDESDSANRELREYVDGIGNWVRANDQWSFECGRYFGYRGIRVLKERKTTLVPKRE